MKLLLIIPQILLALVVVSSASANDLKNHSSPYLALHGNDPVNWMEWGEPAIAKAKKENKLLFVSIGYFACHWCHVMQRESYADKGIAKQLNDNYISIKIDRELNPVLDKRLIEFVQVTTGSAGWPLNVFLTPEGFPLVGATYMPREHFSGVLKQLEGKWKTEQASLTKQAQNMSKTLNAMLQKQELPTKGKSTKQLANGFVNTAMQYADTMQGGFGQQRKFPQIPQLWALLKLNKEKKNKEAGEFLKFTLDQMSTNGLHDELGGGFYRYTTDPGWEIPHFEKMIYTNAMAPLLYFDAADQYQNNQYRKVALETLQFLKNEMRGQSNAFIASLSAVDDKGEEGGFYLWTEKELNAILSPSELRIASLYWSLDRRSELPAGNLPRQQISLMTLSDKLGKTPQETEKTVKALKLKLKARRDKTRKLPRDTKLLAGMNGLALAGFSRGLQYDASLKTTGDKLANFLTSLWDGKKLRRSAANAKVGTLYDYSAVSWGLIKWADASKNARVKQIGVAIATAAWNRFYKDGGWIENPDSLLPQGVKQAHISDSSLISAEALLLEASFLSREKVIMEKATGVLGIVTRNLEVDLYSFGSLMAIATKR